MIILSLFYPDGKNISSFVLSPIFFFLLTLSVSDNGLQSTGVTLHFTLLTKVPIHESVMWSELCHMTMEAILQNW